MEVTRQSFFHWTRVNVALQVLSMSERTCDAAHTSSLSMRLRGGGKRSCRCLASSLLRYIDVPSDTGEFVKYSYFYI